MARGLILVKAAYDADAAVWFVESCDLEGVNAEAPSLEELLQKLPGVILDLLEEALAPLRALLSRSIPNVGDWSTVNVGTVLVDRPYTQEAVPGYRQIVDLSPANNSRFIDAVVLGDEAEGAAEVPARGRRSAAPLSLDD